MLSARELRSQLTIIFTHRPTLVTQQREVAIASLSDTTVLCLSFIAGGNKHAHLRLSSRIRIKTKHSVFHPHINTFCLIIV